MALSYESTRGGQKGVTASQAILKGLAEDGGLFMPTEIPKLDKTLEQLAGMTYQETAYEVMKLFLTDYTEEELKSCIANAYDDKFDTEEIAPLAKADGAYFLELYHGSTIAFKDMALSILPHLMTTAAKKNHADKEIVILTATSGDTGKAAMAGFADVPGTCIIVFYPKGGVSKVQELQMRTNTTIGAAEELKAKGITVTAVCPGPMATEFLAVGHVVDSRPFELLPYCDQVQVAGGALRAARAGQTIYTPRLFYKFYRLLAKLTPAKLMVKLTKT